MSGLGGRIAVAVARWLWRTRFDPRPRRLEAHLDKCFAEQLLLRIFEGRNVPDPTLRQLFGLDPLPRDYSGPPVQRREDGTSKRVSA